MKKITFLFAMLLSAATMFGQSSFEKDAAELKETITNLKGYVATTHMTAEAATKNIAFQELTEAFTTAFKRVQQYENWEARLQTLGCVIGCYQTQVNCRENCCRMFGCGETAPAGCWSVCDYELSLCISNCQ